MTTKKDTFDKATKKYTFVETTEKDTFVETAQVGDKRSAEINNPASHCSLSPQHPQGCQQDKMDPESDDIFLDAPHSPSCTLSPTSTHWAHPSPHNSGRYHGQNADVRTSSSSSSTSSIPKTTSLASINEEEVLNIMEMMGEREIYLAMPPCECDECLFREPDSEALPSTKPLKRQSSWRKIRSFILWSPFIQVFKKHRYPWIQLAGHQGNFHAGEAGCILKKLDPREQACFKKLMSDTLKDYVPEYRGDIDKNEESYLHLQDLLSSFSHPCVMDVKMGVRTYLEDELQKARKSPSMRKDMYQKMIEVDNQAPTPEEHEHKAVSKPRYMQWRDEMSSSVELGFRVEGIKKSDGNSSKDFKKTKSRESVVEVLKSFIGDNENIVEKYIRRLKEIMQTQEKSEFFMSHEVIGSSLLFVHDADENVGVWMIDFGKSEPLPNGVKIDHRSTWNEGNHEDGYLFGLDNLISALEDVRRSAMSSAV